MIKNKLYKEITITVTIMMLIIIVANFNNNILSVARDNPTFNDKVPYVKVLIIQSVALLCLWIPSAFSKDSVKIKTFNLYLILNAVIIFVLMFISIIYTNRFLNEVYSDFAYNISLSLVFYYFGCMVMLLFMCIGYIFAVRYGVSEIEKLKITDHESVNAELVNEIHKSQKHRFEKLVQLRKNTSLSGEDYNNMLYGTITDILTTDGQVAPSLMIKVMELKCLKQDGIITDKEFSVLFSKMFEDQ